MSLSGWERRTLDSIKDRLAESDPRLSGMLATFTRLASGEQMPVREEIRAAARRVTRRSRRKRHPRRDRLCRPARSAYQHLGFQRAALLLWLFTAISLTAVALILGRGGGHSGCAEPWSAVCATSRSGHTTSDGLADPAGFSRTRESLSPPFGYP